MARLDALDMSVFQFNDGNEWVRNFLDGEIMAGTFNHSVGLFPKLSLAGTGPERFRSWEVDWKGIKRPMIDAFLDILSAAPQEMMDRYEALRGLARRFGSGANDWLNRKEPSVASFERRLGEAREPMPTRASIYDELEKVASVFPLDADFVPNMMQVAEGLKASASPVPVTIDPEAGLVVAGLDLETLLPGRRLGEIEMEYRAQTPESLRFSFSNFTEGSGPRVILTRDLAGFSAFQYLEPHARAVDVQPDRVLVDLDRMRRSGDEPLFYSYVSGLMRVEARVAPGMNEGDVFGAIHDVSHQYKTGAKFFIDGSRGRSKVGAMPRNLIGSPFGFQPGVVDLVAVGPSAGVALTGAFMTLGGIRPMA
ncbi:MAG: hypothetical protein WC683_00485 [bacterium]